MRRLLLILVVVLVGVTGLIGAAEAVGNCSIYKTFQTGDSVTAGDLNNLQTTIGVTNLILSCIDDFSANATQMQSTTDPYPGGTESLATSLQVEITAIRHVLKQGFGFTYWYSHSDDINRTVTWNTAARNFCLYCGTVTDTNSHASSRLMDLRVGAVIRFAMNKSGAITSYNSATPENGQLFIGNATTGTWQAARITAGTNITVTNAAGAVTIAAATELPTGNFTDVSGSRVLGTAYQNTGTTDREVAVAITSDATGQCGVYNSSAASPAFLLSFGTVAARFPFHFLVAPNHYYKIAQEAGTCSITYWVERN